MDDTDEEDILKHLVSAITFIQEELDKGHGVLVHCMAGISESHLAYIASGLLSGAKGRSVAIVAAYLMYARELSPTEALDLVRKARPAAE